MASKPYLYLNRSQQDGQEDPEPCDLHLQRLAQPEGRMKVGRFEKNRWNFPRNVWTELLRPRWRCGLCR